MFLIKILKKYESGFSLLQGLILSGVVAGAALVVMKENETSNKLTRSSQTNLAINEMTQQIQSTLLNMRACTNSLRTLVVPDGQEVSVESLLNEAGEPLFVSGSNYLNNQILLERMALKRTGNQGQLNVVFRKIGDKDGRGSGNRTIQREYGLNVNWNANAVVDCYSGLNNSIDDAVTKAIEEICGASSDTPRNGLFKRGEGCDAIPQIQPSMTDPNYEPVISDLTCSDDEGFIGLDFDPTTQKYVKRCIRVYDFNVASCDPNQLLRRRSNGQFDCVSLVCPAGQIFKGLKADGTADCFGCPAGSLLVRKSSPNRWECTNVACAGDEYLVGMENGNPQCVKLVSDSNEFCRGSSQLIAVGGSLKLNCCTPECSGASNRCEGESFPSSNSCGICTGTKVGNCNSASQYCAGTTFLDSANCKECVGTKLARNSTWRWEDTGETRDVGACQNGIQKIEKKQTRICDNNQECGGAGCPTPSEQWVAGVDKPCAIAGKCVGSGYDISMFVIAKTDEVQNGCRTQYRDVYFDIVVSQFKVGNIYSITQGMTFSEEVKSGDTPQTVLQRIATKINAQNMTYPTLCFGAGSTVVTNASVVSSNRLKYHINWQHQPGHSASRSCNNLDKTTCQSTPSCNWDTTSAYVCTGGNYKMKQGTCNGTYYREACTWNGMGMDMGYGEPSGSQEECMYSYPDASSCNAAWSKGCSWGSVPQTCYASSQTECSSLGGGCSWKSYPDDYRSCTATSWEAGCTGVNGGAGVCSWGPR